MIPNQQFSILDHIQSLTPAKEKGKYICPVCGGNNLSINKIGAYSCFNGCEPQDIREAIAPWAEKKKEFKKQQNNFPSEPKIKIKPKRTDNYPKKTIRPKDRREWLYKNREGNELIKVVRVDDGNGKRDFFQCHWDGKGWKAGYGQVKREDIPIYRYREIRDAIAKGETIFIAEGESCCDILWGLGFVATTNIGGSSKWLPNHTKDLKGAKQIVICLDQDIPGVDHSRIVAASLGGMSLSFLKPYPDSPFWENLPAKEGLDVGDWIKELNLTKEDLLAAVTPDLGLKEEPSPLTLEIPTFEATDKALTELENLPSSWTEKALAEYLAQNYQDRLIFDGTTQEWYCYGVEIDGIWSKQESMEINQRFMLELDFLISKYKEIRSEIEVKISWLSEQLKISNQLPQEKKRIEAEIKALSKQCPKIPDYTIRFVESLNKHLTVKLFTRKMAKFSNKGLIPFTNGVLNMGSKELTAHSPDNLLTWCLPYEYNPLAECGPIKQWLLEMCQGDRVVVELIRAFLHGVITSRTDWQKYLELIGPGGTGKSTLIKLAIALVGQQNVHSTTLAKLETCRFETASIKDKRLVVINDSERYTGGSSVLKALTGQDTLPYEQKFKQSTQGFVPDALVMVAANEIPQMSDYTSGLERRRLTLAMTKRIEGHQQRDLMAIHPDRISGEFAPFIPGLLNWVLGMNPEEATQLIKNHSILTPSLEKMKAETLISTNPIAAWADLCLVEVPDNNIYVGSASKSIDFFLYASYHNYSLENGFKPVNNGRFSKLLHDLLVNQLQINTKRGRDQKGAYFTNLAIRSTLDSDKLFISPQYSPDDGNDGAMRVSMTVQTRMDDGTDGDEGKIKVSSNNSPLSHSIVKPEIQNNDVVDDGGGNIPDSPSLPSVPSLPRVPTVSLTIIPTVSTVIAEENQKDESQTIVQVDYNDLIDQTDDEMKRLRWTNEQGRKYLIEQYGKRSRQVLNDNELLEFLNFLKSQPTP